MDMTGNMPREAWVEVRDGRGEPLTVVAAVIDGGTVSAKLPAFEPGTRGTVALVAHEGGVLWYEEVAELPTEPAARLWQF
jgi:hypothetical protein